MFPSVLLVSVGVPHCDPAAWAGTSAYAPGILKRMPEEACQSVESAWSGVVDGYTTATEPAGTESTAEEVKNAGVSTDLTAYGNAGMSGKRTAAATRAATSLPTKLLGHRGHRRSRSSATPSTRVANKATKTENRAATAPSRRGRRCRTPPGRCNHLT